MSTAQRATDGQAWYFIADNLPSHYTWQDLKDAVRCEAVHGVWTDTHINHNVPGNGRGVIRVKRNDEARNLYRYLTSNLVARRRLLVHLYHTLEGTYATFVKCNCNTAAGSSVPCPLRQMSPSMVHAASIVNRQIVPTASRSLPSRPSFHVPHSATFAMSGQGQSAMPVPNEHAAAAFCLPTYAGPAFPETLPIAFPPYAQPGWSTNASQVPSMPPARLLQRQPCMPMQQGQAYASHYVVPSSGLPVNTVHGSFSTENAGVFVSNLSYKATPQEIQALFSKAGRITKCEMQRNPTTGKFKGNATILYASIDGARGAIAMFHHVHFQEMTINVRNDVTTRTHKSKGGMGPGKTAEGNGNPVIVNGSRARR